MLLIEIEKIHPVEIIKWSEPREDGDALHDLPTQNIAVPIDHKEHNRPCGETPLCLADGNAPLTAQFTHMRGKAAKLENTQYKLKNPHAHRDNDQPKHCSHLRIIH